VTSGRLARDPGLQQERTALAWRRTGLALVVGALTVGRLTMGTLGSAVLVPTLVAAALSAWVVSVTLRGKRYAHAHPDEPSFDRILRDGRVPAVVVVVTMSLALGELLSAALQLVEAVDAGGVPGG
jgi:putative membrane protein